MSEQLVSQPTEIQKTDYFSKLGIHLIDALRHHRNIGLWERTSEGKREWGNVSEHCLVEAARAREFGVLLGFPEDLTEDLMTAAALHDAGKRDEVLLAKKEGGTWNTYNKANEHAAQMLKDAGFSERVIRLAGAVGHGSLIETEKVLAKPMLTTDDEAFLVMHYIDDYTVNASWAAPTTEENGHKIGELERRMRKNEGNKNYELLDETAREHLGGRTSFEVQRELGLAAESRLAQLIQLRTSQQVEPVDLPVFIDAKIKQRALL